MSRIISGQVSDEQYLALLNEAIERKVSVSDLVTLKLFGCLKNEIRSDQMKDQNPAMTFVKEYKSKNSLKMDNIYSFYDYLIEKTTKGNNLTSKKGYVLRNEGYMKLRVYKLSDKYHTDQEEI